MSRREALRPRLLAITGFAMLLLAGCNDAQLSPTAYRIAPSQQGEADSHQRRNVANPNAPFTMPASAPKLVARQPLLDVDDVPPCAATQLNLFETRAEANGSRHRLQLTLQNAGDACRLRGFPAIALLAADSSVLGSIEIRRVSEGVLAASLSTAPQGAATSASLVSGEVEAAPSPYVLLVPNGAASFQLGWTSGPSCTMASRIAISAPGIPSSPVIIPRPLTVCEHQVLITEVAADRD
ncbi:DUF4232 domain-containing protein [Acidipila sp. EB88]|uniref:DUF4232 domain-containing protein n=1 Tax=Acidipila sp. EB88 TaxID=2305226 RepID=UPI0013152F03|nr:DUF4232 domain-containing protein [Acidipila sp. EB88]